MKSEMYTAAQGLIARQHQLDVISNNIANANTTGFREVSPFFKTFNKALETGPANPLNNAANNQPVGTGIYAHSRQGPIKETGNPLDIAIQGDGYFKLNTPFGTRYTRNGNFTLDNTGKLITANGYEVLDVDNTPITLNGMASDTLIKQDGRILQDRVEQGQIALISLDNKAGLVPEEDTLLANQDPTALEIPANGEMFPGSLEGSNVNIAKQMIEMIVAQRTYEANTRTIRSIDTGMNQAVIQGFAPR